MTNHLLKNLSEAQLSKLQAKLDLKCRANKMKPFDLKAEDPILWQELVLRILKFPTKMPGSPGRSEQEIRSIFDYARIADLFEGLATNAAMHALIANALKVRRLKHKRDGTGSSTEVVKGVLHDSKHRKAYARMQVVDREEMAKWPNEAWQPREMGVRKPRRK